MKIRKWLAKLLFGADVVKVLEDLEPILVSIRNTDNTDKERFFGCLAWCAYNGVFVESFFFGKKPLKTNGGI